MNYTEAWRLVNINSPGGGEDSHVIKGWGHLVNVVPFRGQKAILVPLRVLILKTFRAGAIAVVTLKISSQKITSRHTSHVVCSFTNGTY